MEYALGMLIGGFCGFIIGLIKGQTFKLIPRFPIKKPKPPARKGRAK